MDGCLEKLVEMCGKVFLKHAQGEYLEKAHIHLVGGFKHFLLSPRSLGK